MMKDDIDILLLRNLLSYDPDSGELRWKNPTSPRVRSGDVAGRINIDGYVTVSIKSGFYRGHRVAFAIWHGRWPNGQLDHINGVRHDNRMVNLRECSNAQNQHNRRRSRRNKSGIKGVYFDKHSGKWRALIRISSKKIYLGSFSDKDAAASAYAAAARNYHGTFARTD